MPLRLGVYSHIIWAVLLLSHAGIALGTAVVLNGIFGGHSKNERPKAGEASSETAARSHFAERWVTSLGRRIDIRVLLAGALVPDIVDKPLGRLVFGTFGCRLFCHSLAFLMIVASAGLCLHFRRRQNWLLVLGFGILTHLVLDEMWLDTQTLFWPAQGLSFPTVDHGAWEQSMLRELFTSPRTYVPELVGMAILACFAWVLVRRGKLRAFVRYGQT